MVSTKRKKRKTPLLISFGIIAFLGVTLFAAFYFLFLGVAPEKKLSKQNTQAQAPSKKQKTTTPVISPTRKKIQANTTPKARLTLIIDDIGHQKKLAEQIIALDLQLSFSILPRAPFASYLGKLAKDRGRDVLLHLPMEPSGSKWNPGPGALMLDMPHEKMATTLRADLLAIPMAIGINNHMGSKFSASKQEMQFVLQEIKGKNLFFVDSLTSSKSVIYQVAREMGIKTARRDIFIDNVKDPKKIKQQLAALVRLAKKRGQAIGIGHPYKATLAALADYQQTLRQEVDLVGIHQLVK